ncbi:2,3-bisphosphoglycerate-independent phosphoglycerate mutase [Limobrevibacterium gyesilva]|uniref:2,3-bisphosphoglycerate-independent phosphoglycerate mutase n=1 Tax=Limobrevibacterium gyesilva TaxID=2991712 RepID=A0AA41YSL3_9PROT|nr:2,3-bisphosphoglycerate-independent phosphoglycerate mutase [Limobrevibacterium gyesilva]MCW3477568.1 2,3-bisphosphoglycerate-independent phosphoglycerate mutase [Limobrevibacterium gyesilva]
MPPTPRPVMLVILDGWGWREDTADNAVRQARTPNFSRLWQTCPHAFLGASGLDVGLPAGQMGNSEVGHLNIGAGRVVMQDLPRIGQSVADGSLRTRPALLDLIAKLKASGGTCHLLGLVSPGGVHSHQDHGVALARAVAAAGIPIVAHAFTDGRDTPPRSAGEDIRRFLAALPDGVRIATVSGRYYAMDRDKRWDRVAKAYMAIAEGQGPSFADAASVVDAAYGSGVTDEFVVPAVVADYRGMKDGDGILCFNFRADRVREILGALVDPAFTGFERPRRIAFAAAAGMTSYSDALARHLGVLFPPQTMDNLLGQVVARAGRTQLRMAETEKYAHVTYFLNGGEETPNPGEDRIMVPSPKVATYDLQPEMSAPELADKAVAAIGSGKYDLIVLNFANPDMVGHTGSLAAAIKAVETVDAGLGRIADAITAAGGALLVTADHGNCEMMRDPATGGPHTAHTTNKVPVLLLSNPGAPLHDGRLADIAPTLLQLLRLPQPPEMTGRRLTEPTA